MSEVPVVLITTTVDSEEDAHRIAEAAVSQNLAACAQVTGPIISHYIWKGEQRREMEWSVSLKTLLNLELNLMNFISELHPYETPELISVRVNAVSEAYLEWMLRTTGD